MTDERPVTYRALNAGERVALENGLAFASKLVGVSRLPTMAEVQMLFDQAVAERILDDDVLIAIGLAYGQQIIIQSGFDWVRVSDQWGDETCVGPIGKSINCAPISMVQKRIERAEAEDLQQLATVLITRLNELLPGTGDWS